MGGGACNKGQWGGGRRPSSPPSHLLFTTSPPSPQVLMEGEAGCEAPILFITTPGADPSQELAEYAKLTIGRERYHEVGGGGRGGGRQQEGGRGIMRWEGGVGGAREGRRRVPCPLKRVKGA